MELIDNLSRTERAFDLFAPAQGTHIGMINDRLNESTALFCPVDIDVDDGTFMLPLFNEDASWSLVEVDGPGVIDPRRLEGGGEANTDYCMIALEDSIAHLSVSHVVTGESVTIQKPLDRPGELVLTMCKIKRSATL